VPPISWDSASETRWDTLCNLVIRHVMGDHCSGTDERAFSDRQSPENDGATSDRGAAFYPGRYNLPVFVGLQTSDCSGTGIKVIDEHDPMPDKDIILDGYTLADERVRRDLTLASDRGIFLDLDECSNFRFVANSAPVKVDQIWLEDPNPLPQDHVSSDWHEDHSIRHVSVQKVLTGNCGCF
jgi:hypothetical protein